MLNNIFSITLTVNLPKIWNYDCWWSGASNENGKSKICHTKR